MLRADAETHGRLECSSAVTGRIARFDGGRPRCVALTDLAVAKSPRAILTVCFPTERTSQSAECRRFAAQLRQFSRDDARHPERGDPSAD